MLINMEDYYTEQAMINIPFQFFKVYTYRLNSLERSIKEQIKNSKKYFVTIYTIEWQNRQK